MNDFERSWREQTRAKVRAFIEEMGNEGKCIRLRALYEQLWTAEAELMERYSRYQQSRNEDRPYGERAFIASYIPEIEKQIEKLTRQIRAILAEAQGRDRKDRITPEMIERAREYPIDTLLGVTRRGNILCISHEEKHPSMGIKNNRARCFSCGYFGDSIDVYMKLNGAGFAETVRALQ